MSLVAIRVELAVIVVAGIWFMAVFAARRSHRDQVWWHLMALAAVGVGEAATLFAASLGAPLPMWLFAVGYGLIDAVVIHRLVLLYWARRKREDSAPRADTR